MAVTTKVSFPTEPFQKQFLLMLTKACSAFATSLLLLWFVK